MSIVRSSAGIPRLLLHSHTTHQIFLTAFSSSFGSQTNLDHSMKKLIDSQQYKQALELFEQQEKSQQRTGMSINMALKACILLKDYERGIQIEKQLSTQAQHDPFVQTSLLQLYMHYGDTKNAERIYSAIIDKSNRIYTVLFNGFIRNNMLEKVLDTVDEMKTTPNEYSLTMIFKACARMNNVRAKEIGLQLFEKMPQHFHTNAFVTTTALDMLMSFGETSRAEELFHSMEEKTVFSYGALLAGYVGNDMHEKALDLFEQMTVEKDEVIYLLVFKACAGLKNERAKRIGKQLLDQILNKPRTKNNLWNSAIQMLMCFGEINRAEQLFQSLTRRDAVGYGVLLRGYIENGMDDKALDLFEQMAIEPTEMIYTLIFKACAKLNNQRAQKIGYQALNQISKKPHPANAILNSAIHMLMCVGDVIRAEQMFQSLKEKDVVSYGAMMRGYVENGLHEKALDLFAQMPIDPDDVIYTLVFKTCAQLSNARAKVVGMKLVNELTSRSVTNPITLTAAIHMLMNFNDVDRAEQLFQSIKEKDLLAYNVMLNGYITHNKPAKFQQFFEEIKQQLTNADASILAALLQTCAQLGLPSFARSVLAEISPHLIHDTQLVNTMIHMWGKAGEVKKAYEVFQSVQKPNAVTYTNMINAYGLNGHGLDAVKLYQQMPSDLPDEMCHTCVLNACSHSGLAHHARSIFNNINNKDQRIYTSMIDCLSRLQMFDEAEQLLEEYEHQSSKPHLPMHMALLSGTRNARNADLSSRLFQRMERLFPDEKDALISSSILLGNSYLALGDYEQASAIRRHRLKHHGKKVKPAVTWTEIGDEIVSFTAHDRSHPLTDEIYAEAKVMANELLEHGHQFNASWITRPLEDTETVESVLCGHSERLALAYHFIRGRRPSKIHLVKNLRVCGDCHHATKLIAKIRQCEIIVRDANRIHHFQPNGQCSCMDHF